MKLHPYHQITEITSKYNLKQLAAVAGRDFILARKLGVSIDDYIALIK